MANRLSDDYQNNNPDNVLPIDSAASRAAANENTEKLNAEVSRLSTVISNLSKTVMALPMKTAIAAKDVVDDVYSKTREEIHVEKPSYGGRMGMVAGGALGGVIAKNIVESQAFQNIKNSIKDKVRNTASSAYYGIKDKFRKNKNDGLSSDVNYQEESYEPSNLRKAAAKKNTGRYSTSINTVSKLYQKSPDSITAVDRLRISMVKGSQPVFSKSPVKPAEVTKLARVKEKKIPKAAEGAYVNQEGLVHAHQGETITPVNAISKQYKLMSYMYDMMEQQAKSLVEIQKAFTDEEKKNALTQGLEMIFPLFSGGMYKNDIARNKNPLVTITSGILEMYRWQRLYGELTKRQLNVLIGMEGGPQQEVVGKRNLLFEQMAKWRGKIHERIMKKMAADKKKGKKSSMLTHLAASATGGIVGDILFEDPELFQLKLRESGRAMNDALMQGIVEGQKMQPLGKLIWQNTYFGMKDVMPKEIRTAGRFGPGGSAIGRLTPDDVEGMMEDKKWTELYDVFYKSASTGLKKSNKKVKQKTKKRKRKAGDAHFSPGSIKEVVTSEGQAVTPAKDDVVTLKRSKKGITSKKESSIISYVKNIAGHLKFIKDNTKETSKSTSRTQKHLSDQTDLMKEEEKRNKKKRRQEMFDKIKGMAGKGALGILRIIGSLGIGGLSVLAGIAASLILAPKATLGLMKWAVTGLPEFFKSLYMFSKVTKILGFAMKMMGKTLNKVFGRQIIKLFGRNIAKKTGVKVLGKTAGKMFAKKIPVLGSLIGLWMGITRFKKGDVLGGLGEIASGVAAIFPGPGTAISLLIDGLLVARDLHKMNKDKPKPPVKPASGSKARAALKLIPGVGTILGISDAIKSFKTGNYAQGIVEIVSGISTLFPGAGTMIGGVLQALLVLNRTGKIKPKAKTGSAIADFFIDILSFVKDVVVKAVKLLAKTIWGLGKLLTKAIWWSIKALTKTLWWSVKTVFWTIPKALIKGIWWLIKDLVKGVWWLLKASIKGIVKGIWWAIKAQFKLLKAIFWSIPKAIVKGIVSGVLSLFKGIGKIGKWAKNKATAAKEWVGNKAAAAEEWISDKANAVKDKAKQVKDVLTDPKKLKDVAIRAKNAVVDKTKKGVSNVWSATKNFFSDPFGNKEKEKNIAKKLSQLCDQYNKKEVMALFNKIGDVDEVKKILEKPDIKDKMGMTVARLINAYPQAKDEIISLLKANTPVDEIIKIVKKKYQKAGEKAQAVITDQDVKTKQRLEDKLKNVNEMLSKYEDKKLTGQQLQTKAQLEEQKAMYEQTLSGMKDNEVDTGERSVKNDKQNLNVTNLSNNIAPDYSITSNLLGAPNQVSSKPLTNINNSIGGIDANYINKIKSQTGIQHGTNSVDPIELSNNIISLKRELRFIKNPEDREALSVLIQIYEKQLKKITNRKVNDWFGKASAIVTKSGEILTPARNDIVSAVKTNDNGLGGKARNRVDTALDNIGKLPGEFTKQTESTTRNRVNNVIDSGKQAPRRFTEGALSTIRSNLTADNIINIARGKRDVGDILQSAVNNGKSQAINPINSSIQNAKRLPTDILNSGKGKIDQAGNIARRVPQDILSDVATAGREKVTDLENWTKDKLPFNSKRANVQESNSSPNSNKIKNIQQNSVQEQINNGAATVKSGKALNESLKQSSKETTNNVNHVVNNLITNMSSKNNVSSGGGNGGGNSNQLQPFWKPIDLILSGNSI